MTSLHSYTSVRDYQGNEILEKDIVTTQAIGEDTAYIMNRLLHSVLFDAGGTARGIHPDANIMDSIGKTGTTNDNKDVWFVGLTPKYVMATWYGYDENERWMITTIIISTKTKAARRAIRRFRLC